MAEQQEGKKRAWEAAERCSQMASSKRGRSQAVELDGRAAWIPHGWTPTVTIRAAASTAQQKALSAEDQRRSVPTQPVAPNSAAWAADPDTLFERCDEIQAQQKHHAAPDLLMHPPPPRRQRSFRHTLPHVGWLKDGWHPLRLGRLTDGSIRPYDPSSW
ncbi:hypothetical protein PaG_04565 [Moesziomyces aphidis]|uniref:Uncharacterized protein n=1 Tax=Moesziomyces aphidis TaxID=84754 RepID=W3VGH0_MOEAP|nr:hypothetical protein PaG_04565 [Moesziomyces aphidis]